MRTNPSFYSCPYCNAEMKFELHSEVFREEFKVTACCGRTIKVIRELVPVTNIVAPAKHVLEKAGVEGDISPVEGMKWRGSSRRESRWTSVYCSGFHYYVRLVPAYAELEHIGWPHGISLADSFSSEFAAHIHADRIDQFMDNVFAAFLDEPEIIEKIKAAAAAFEEERESHRG